VVVAGSIPELGQDALLVESAVRKHSVKVTHITLQGQLNLGEALWMDGWMDG
jgi:hypothetical protein